MHRNQIPSEVLDNQTIDKPWSMCNHFGSNYYRLTLFHLAHNFRTLELHQLVKHSHNSFIHSVHVCVCVKFFRINSFLNWCRLFYLSPKHSTDGKTVKTNDWGKKPVLFINNSYHTYTGKPNIRWQDTLKLNDMHYSSNIDNCIRNLHSKMVYLVNESIVYIKTGKKWV